MSKTEAESKIKHIERLISLIERERAENTSISAISRRKLSAFVQKRQKEISEIRRYFR